MKIVRTREEFVKDFRETTLCFGIDSGVEMRAYGFRLPNENGNKVCLKDFEGQWVVLYFHPKDDTTECTKEAKDFTEHIDEFEKLDTIVIDNSPESKATIKKYGVWRLKKMYGRSYYGAVRSTFLIDPDGNIVYEWKLVKVKGHVEDVLEKLRVIK